MKTIKIIRAIYRKVFFGDLAFMFWGGYLLFCGFPLLAGAFKGNVLSFLVGSLILYSILFPFAIAALKHWLQR